MVWLYFYYRVVSLCWTILCQYIYYYCIILWCWWIFTELYHCVRPYCVNIFILLYGWGCLFYGVVGFLPSYITVLDHIVSIYLLLLYYFWCGCILTELYHCVRPYCVNIFTTIVLFLVWLYSYRVISLC